MNIELKIDNLEGYKIPFDEATHKGVCYTLYNSKFESIFPVTHCKDFLNELWYAYFEKDMPDYVYKYRPSTVEVKRIDSVTNFLLFTGDNKTNIVRDIQFIDKKEYVIEYIYKAVERVLGNTNIIKNVEVSERGLLVSVRTYIFKYSTINSLLSYIFRTALEASEYMQSDVDKLTNLLIDSDHVYYSQHLKFKEIINTPLLLKNLRVFTWASFYYKNNIRIKDIVEFPKRKVNLHNESGFVSYIKHLKDTPKNIVNTYLQNTNKKKLK